MKDTLHAIAELVRVPRPRVLDRILAVAKDRMPGASRILSNPAFEVRPVGILTNSAIGIGLLVVLGLALRLYHYLRGPSLWHDEAALVVNIVGKDFGELLGPLDCTAAAPPLFLWIERAVCQILGSGLYALRLPPLIASCAAMFLVASVARRWLPAAAAFWAVLLFACSDRLLWHACETKQYAVDVFAALALMAVYGWTEAWPLARRLTTFALLSPFVLALSYPSCFVCGAVLLVFLPAIWQSRQAADWFGYGLFGLAVLGTFAALVAGPIAVQRNPDLISCWREMHQFPDWRNPLSVPSWTLKSTVDLVGYACKPVGTFLAPLALIGMVSLWRRGVRGLLVLSLAPIALVFGASCFEGYSYGGTRLLSYTIPAIVLLVAAGIPPALDWLRTRRPIAAVALTAFLLVPLARAAYHVVLPWPRADCAAAAGYVTRARRAGDPVVSNHWEYLYYFRGLGPAHMPMEKIAPPAEGRVWVVITGATPADRKPCLDAFQADDWQTHERREFERTTVLLVERPMTSKTARR